MKHLKDYKLFEGKGPKGKDLTVFVRFGGVNLKNQHGYSKDPKSLHEPPAPRGFYAMPKVAQEMFLVGSIGSFQKSTMPKEKDWDGHLSKMSDEEREKYWEELEKRKKIAKSAMRKEFKKTDGNIWHHFTDLVPRNEIIEEHGGWVKTTIKTWQKAFNKASIQERYGSKEFGTKSINAARGINGYYGKDHYEVFFDEKV